MKKPNITSGKFQVVNVLNRYYSIMHIETGQQPISCFENEYIPISNQQTKANAELICESLNITNAGFDISAIPDLIEALEEVTEALRYVEFASGDLGEDTKMFHDAKKPSIKRNSNNLRNKKINK